MTTRALSPVAHEDSMKKMGIITDRVTHLGGDGKPWRIGTEVYGDRDILPRDVISRKLSVPNAERIFFIRHALRAGFTIEEIFQLRAKK